jgi:hypothetical protein
MIIDIFITIFQANRKAHEEFLEGINKISMNKRKKIKIYIFIAEKQNIELIDTLIN